jgi:hypothetical protein
MRISRAYARDNARHGRGAIRSRLGDTTRASSRISSFFTARSASTPPPASPHARTRALFIALVTYLGHGVHRLVVVACAYAARRARARSIACVRIPSIERDRSIDRSIDRDSRSRHRSNSIELAIDAIADGSV